MKFTGLLALGLLLAACGSGGGAIDAGPEGPHLLWAADPQSLDNPFPDARVPGFRADFYRPFVLPKAVTGKAKAFFKTYASSAAAELTGFGNFGPMLLRPSVAVDPTSLAGTVARLRKTATGYEVLEQAVAIEHSHDVLAGTGRTLALADGGTADFPEFFLARPGVPLREGDEGLLVVTKGLKATDGRPFVRGRDWDASAGRAALTSAAAAALGVGEAEVLLALPITGTAVTPVLKSLAAWVETPAGLAAVTVPPKSNADRPVGVWTNADADWSVIRDPWLEKASFGKPASAVGRVVIGTLAARDLRSGGAWKKEWVADPSLAPVVALPFVLSVPVGAKPAGGWPTVVAAHGVAGRNVPGGNDPNSYCLENAQLLAAEGFACLGIDAPSHGARGNFTDFFDVSAPELLRDKFREMTFDLLQLCRAAPQIDVDGDGAGDLDPALGFLGNSLGGIMGSAFVPVGPRIQTAVLNVPGGGLSNILASDEIRDLIGLLIAAKTDVGFGTLEYYSSFMIFRAVAQPFFESADPVNIASALPMERAVLVQEGVGDRTIPNFTTENLAGAMGLSAPTAAITGTAPLHVFSRADPAKYLSPEQAKTFNGHEVFGSFAPVRSQAMTFLSSKGRAYQVP